jgi:hypothetical protein
MVILMTFAHIYRQQNLQKNGIIYETSVNHIAGHPYLSQNDKLLLQVRTNNTINLIPANSITAMRLMKEKIDINTGIEIPINQITRYEIKTESEIQKDVTLTRLLALGIFAFGLKKKTEINNSYLILSYVQNNVPIDCIFKNAVNNQQLGNIISTINRLKIEQNSIQSN